MILRKSCTRPDILIEKKRNKQINTLTFVLYNVTFFGSLIVTKAVVIKPTTIPFSIKPIKNQTIDNTLAGIERGAKSP